VNACWRLTVRVLPTVWSVVLLLVSSFTSPSSSGQTLKKIGEKYFLSNMQTDFTRILQLQQNKPLSISHNPFDPWIVLNSSTTSLGFKQAMHTIHLYKKKTLCISDINMLKYLHSWPGHHHQYLPPGSFHPLLRL